MKFPKHISFKVNSAREYEVLLRGLKAAHAGIAITDQDIIYKLIKDLTISDGSGNLCSLPDAYLEVGGIRMTEGRRADLELKFNSEINSHSASVVLYARDGLTDYKVIRARRQANKDHIESGVLED